MLGATEQTSEPYATYIEEIYYSLSRSIKFHSIILQILGA